MCQVIGNDEGLAIGRGEQYHNWRFYHRHHVAETLYTVDAHQVFCAFVRLFVRKVTFTGSFRGTRHMLSSKFSDGIFVVLMC